MVERPSWTEAAIVRATPVYTYHTIATQLMKAELAKSYFRLTELRMCHEVELRQNKPRSKRMKSSFDTLSILCSSAHAFKYKVEVRLKQECVV